MNDLYITVHPASDSLDPRFVFAFFVSVRRDKSAVQAH